MMTSELAIEVSNDLMQAKIVSIKPSIIDRPDQGWSLFEEQLLKNKVSFGLIEGVFEQLVSALEKGKEVAGMFVAKGVAPQKGKDGYLELLFQRDMSAGLSDEAGRIDYHERGFIQTVTENEELVIVHLPEEGINGMNIRGDTLLAQKGDDALYQAGENVMVLNGKLISTSGGMVLYNLGVISVTDVFEQPGDVDYHTGNIHMEKGSVVVRGSVEAGFCVSAEANVLVQKTVMEAEVVAGGDVEIKQGVIDSEVRAGGNVVLNFGQNSKVWAGGDVIVTNSLHNCKIEAHGKVMIVSGKGVLRGGIVRCSRDLEVKELGSKSAVATKVEIGLYSDTEKALKKELEEINDTISQITFLQGSQEDIGDDLSEDKKKEKLDILDKLNNLNAKKIQISSRLKIIGEERRTKNVASVKVLEITHPGVVISIFGKAYTVNNPLGKCSFIYDESSEQVVTQV